MLMYNGAGKYEIVLDELECTLSIETLQYLFDEKLSKEEICDISCTGKSIKR